MLSRRNCPITGSSDVREVLRLPYDDGFLAAWTRKRGWEAELSGRDYAILANDGIGFHFQENVLDDAEEAARRERLAVRPVRDAGVASLSLAERCHKAEDAMLVRLLHPGLLRPKVFDFGMATGEWLLLAKAYGAEVWGTDLDPRALKACDEHGIRFTPLGEAPEGYFDFVNADQVFEHLPDPLGAGRILAAKLAPGGILKVTTPGDRTIGRKLARLRTGCYNNIAAFERDFFPLSPLSHVNLFTAGSLRELGHRIGLEPFRIPLGTSYAAMTGFLSPRQFNRNLLHPLKRHLAQGTWQFFVKKPEGSGDGRP